MSGNSLSLALPFSLGFGDVGYDGSGKQRGDDGAIATGVRSSVRREEKLSLSLHCPSTALL